MLDAGSSDRFDFEAFFRAASAEAEAAQAAMFGHLCDPNAPEPLPGPVEPLAELWMRAARSLQMAEKWRAQAATWEWLGNLLGLVASDEGAEARRLRYCPPSGRHEAARFYVISDDEWRAPKRNDTDEYGDPRAKLRHQQAWTYQWAARAMHSYHRYDDAARLYRRAGVAWEKSDHQSALRRAATAYYDAATSAARTTRIETRHLIFERWCPSCLRDRRSEESCPRSGHTTSEPGRPEEEPQGDVARLLRCWDAIQADLADEAARGEAYDEECRQLSMIQQELASNGDRNRAREVYRRRQERESQWRRRRRSWRSWRTVLDWFVHRAGWVTSRNGSDVRRFLAVSVVAYFVVLPLAWWPAVPPSSFGGSGNGFLQSLAFCSSTMVTLTTGHFVNVSWLVTLFQSLHALAGVLTLGYVLWIAQRSYAA